MFLDQQALPQVKKLTCRPICIFPPLPPQPPIVSASTTQRRLQTRMRPPGSLHPHGTLKPIQCQGAPHAMATQQLLESPFSFTCFTEPPIHPISTGLLKIWGTKLENFPKNSRPPFRRIEQLCSVDLELSCSQNCKDCSSPEPTP